jgi:S1-C subfamily serine protease
MGSSQCRVSSSHNAHKFKGDFMTNPNSQNELVSLSSALSQLVSASSASIVAVKSNRHQASGFLWRSGLVVTAAEALSHEGPWTVVLASGNTLTATLAGRDPTTDIALLRIDDKTTATASLSSDPVTLGAIAVALAADGEGATTAAFGIVSRASGPWRSMRGGEIDQRIELDARLSSRAEGGLAFTSDGKAFGMVVRGARRRALVIPAATIERVASRLESHGSVAHGYLGLGLQPISADGHNEAAAMIMSIDQKGPAAAAGLFQGDILVSWNDLPLHSVRKLTTSLGPDSIGQKAQLGIIRAGQHHKIALIIAERPQA